MSFEIRRASVDDAPAIARIMQASRLENNPDTIRITRLLPEHCTLVAVDAGEIAGFVDAFTTTAVDGIIRWEVDLLGVDPELQGRGIARRLVEAVVIDGRQRGIAYSRALVRTNNIPAQRSFARCGFTPVGVLFYLYVTDSADEPIADTHPEASLIPVETLTYSGIWVEGARSFAALQLARTRTYQQGGSTAGAVIASDDLAALAAAESAGYVRVGEFDWLERTISDAASGQS